MEALQIVSALVEEELDDPVDYVKGLSSRHPVYAALATRASQLEGSFDGKTFTVTKLKPHLPVDDLIRQAEPLLSRTGVELNKNITMTLQQEYDEMVSQETVDNELRTFRFDAEGFQYGAEDDEEGNLSFDQLSDELKAQARGRWYEYLSGVDWWSTVYDKWIAKLNALGFHDVEIEHQQEDGNVQAGFTAGVFDFKQWAKFGSFQNLSL